MTKDNKDLNLIGELKTQLNIPKTETRIILETEDLYPDLSQRSNRSKLSPAARAKVVNHNKPYQSLNQDSYGPCSYYGCNHKDKPFDLDISIEGCKWWATSYETSLPGNWTWSPTNSYLYRDSLWLSHIGHAYDADSLIGQNSLYTVGTLGQYAAEDDEFRGGAQNFIQAYVKEHRKGYPINEKETLLSSTTRATKWTVRIAGSVAATTFLGPGGAIVAGAGTWMVGKGAQELCENKKAKSIWGTVKDTGGDSFWGGVSGSVNKIVNTKGLCDWKAHESKTFEFVKGCVDSSTESAMQHNTHIAFGRNYDSNCSVCNP